MKLLYPVLAFGCLAFVSPAICQEVAARGHGSLDSEDYQDPDRAELFEKFNPTPNEVVKQFALNHNFTFPEDVTTDRKIHAPRVLPSVFGIDVSQNQDGNGSCKFPLRATAINKASFVYIRVNAAKGDHVDTCFRSYWTQVPKLQGIDHIMRGAYFYVTPGADPALQAQHIVDTLKANGGAADDDLPISIDLEWIYDKSGKDLWSSVTPDELLDKIAVISRIIFEYTKKEPVIYTQPEWWKGMFAVPMAKMSKAEQARISARLKSEIYNRYPLWDSVMPSDGSKSLDEEIPTQPTGWNWAIWQFSNGAELSTIYAPTSLTDKSHALDVTIFHGTVAEFRAALAKPGAGQ